MAKQMRCRICKELMDEIAFFQCDGTYSESCHYCGKVIPFINNPESTMVEDSVLRGMIGAMLYMKSGKDPNDKKLMEQDVKKVEAMSYDELMQAMGRLSNKHNKSQ